MEEVDFTLTVEVTFTHFSTTHMLGKFKDIKKRSPTVIMVRKSDFGMSYSLTHPLLYTSFTLYARICSFRKNY